MEVSFVILALNFIRLKSMNYVFKTEALPQLDRTEIAVPVIHRTDCHLSSQRIPPHENRERMREVGAERREKETSSRNSPYA